MPHEQPTTDSVGTTTAPEVANPEAVALPEESGKVTDEASGDAATAGDEAPVEARPQAGETAAVETSTETEPGDETEEPEAQADAELLEGLFTAQADAETGGGNSADPAATGQSGTEELVFKEGDVQNGADE